MREMSRPGAGMGITRRTVLSGMIASALAPAILRQAHASPRVQAPGGSGGEPPLPRSMHTVTTLSDGRALVAGGFYFGPLASVQIYDGSSNSWSSTAPLLVPRQLHAATLLPNGRVLITGGIYLGALAEAEIFDPTTGTWTVAAPMNLPRSGHSATLLGDGMVMVTGGTYLGALAGAELFDGTSWTFA